MKSLVLAEKPSVGREIARVLGCTKPGGGKRPSYYEGTQYIVTWALGHLVELAEPEDYDTKYQTWRMEDLPILPEHMKKKTIRETAGQMKAIQRLAERKDLKELIIATDAGREGELVARWIMDRVHWKKPFRRLWISSQTDRAIKEGFQKLRPGKEFDPLYDSAVCRAEADWLIGLNVTRALTVKYKTPLSAGRVQTPTLSMVMEREHEIEAFESVPYQTIETQFGQWKATWRDAKTGNGRIFQKELAEQLEQKLKDQTASIVDVQSKQKSEPSPLPYDLTELQRDANRKFGFSAKQTSNVLQQLYERHKLVTYPRTDSRHLSTDMMGTWKSRLDGMQAGYSDQIRSIGRQPVILKAAVNNQKVTDHHAIIPTEERLRLQDLSTDERRLYDLIARRFLALFYPPFRYVETKVTLSAAGQTLTAAGRVIEDAGWKSLYGGASASDGSDDSEDNDKEGFTDRDQHVLPKGLKPGQSHSIRQVIVRTGHTQPPPRFTEASLLTLMEKHQLGTPATRADIIEKLLSGDVIERQGKQMRPTPKGKQLLELVTQELRSPELTAKWENQLESIAKGRGDKRSFLVKIRETAQTMVSEVRNSTAEYQAYNTSNSHCPECGKMLQQVKSKRGTILVCLDESCNYKRSKDPIKLKRRCPQCRKNMEMREGKAGKFAHCRRCNVIETLGDERGGANKREQQKLVKKYAPEKSDFGSSLADALKEALEKKDG